MSNRLLPVHISIYSLLLLFQPMVVIQFLAYGISETNCEEDDRHTSQPACQPFIEPNRPTGRQKTIEGMFEFSFLEHKIQQNLERKPEPLNLWQRAQRNSMQLIRLIIELLIFHVAIGSQVGRAFLWEALFARCFESTQILDVRRAQLMALDHTN